MWKGSILFGERGFALSDLRGLNRLVIDATTGVTDVVEAMHQNIAWIPGAGLIYRSIRGIARFVGGGIDAALAPFASLGMGSSAGREAFVAALNGVLGDHLVATGNPLAIP